MSFKTSGISRYPAIRESIKLLGYNCQICNASQKINLHHKDKNPQNNPLNGSNWQRLCTSCHLKLHWLPRKKFISRQECVKFHSNLRKLKRKKSLENIALKQFNSIGFLRTKDICEKMNLTRERIRQLRNEGFLNYTRKGKIFIYPLNYKK